MSQPQISLLLKQKNGFSVSRPKVVRKVLDRNVESYWVINLHQLTENVLLHPSKTYFCKNILGIDWVEKLDLVQAVENQLNPLKNEEPTWHFLIFLIGFWIFWILIEKQMRNFEISADFSTGHCYLLNIQVDFRFSRISDEAIFTHIHESDPHSQIEPAIILRNYWN